MDSGVDDMADENLISEIKRKMFHLLGLLYVAGLYFLPRKLFIGIMLGVLAAEILFELCRLKVPSFNDWLQNNYGGLFRQEEKNQFSGVVWMAGGVLITALLIGPVLPAVTALLFLILGDSAASLVGKRVRGIRWPNSPKTLSGSLGCFLVCCGAGLLLLWPQFDWKGILITALVVTLSEVGYLPLNDNLIVPLAASLAMLVLFNLRPFFLSLF